MTFTYINKSGFSGFYKESLKHKTIITNFIKSHNMPKDFENQCILEVNRFIGEGLYEIATASVEKERYERGTNVCDLYFHKYIDPWKRDELDIRQAAVKMLITIKVLYHLNENETDEKDKRDLSMLTQCYKEKWMMQRTLREVLNV